MWWPLVFCALTGLYRGDFICMFVSGHQTPNGKGFAFHFRAAPFLGQWNDKSEFSFANESSHSNNKIQAHDRHQNTESTDCKLAINLILCRRQAVTDDDKAEVRLSSYLCSSLQRCHLTLSRLISGPQERDFNCNLESDQPALWTAEFCTALLQCPSSETKFK